MSYAKLSSVLFCALMGLPLVGCAADASDANDEEEGVSEDALQASRVQPGVFKLYADADQIPSQGCDVYTKLELVNEPGGRARLSEDLAPGSLCRIAVFPNAREFRLTQSGTSCGSKIYKGSRRKAGKTYRITVTDHRTRMCRDLVPAQIIVDESEAGSTSPTTKYSYDGPAPLSGSFPAGDATSLSGRLFKAMKDHATATPSETAKFVQRAGGSTVTFESDDNLAQCTGTVLMGGVRYTCHFDVKPGGFEWTSSSDSVQAELHEALRVATSGGRVAELKDGANAVRCEATTLGMAQVMSYRCDVSIAP